MWNDNRGGNEKKNRIILMWMFGTIVIIAVSVGVKFAATPSAHILHEWNDISCKSLDFGMETRCGHLRVDFFSQ